MIRFLISKLSATPIPWIILHGPLRGAYWSLYPRTSYWRGAYDPEFVALLLRYLPATKACWDVGARFGYFSLLMERYVKPHQQVIALEPSPETYKRLSLHLRWNKSNVKAFNCAASDQSGSSVFLDYGSSLDSSNHPPYPGEWIDHPGCRHTPILTIKLDQLIQEKNLSVPGLVKIDVEGHGLQVLLGMTTILKEHFPTLRYSVHGEEETTGKKALLEKIGYTIQRIGPPHEAENATDYLATPSVHHAAS